MSVHELDFAELYQHFHFLILLFEYYLPHLYTQEEEYPT